VRKAQRWPWSSVGSPPSDILVPQLSLGPVPRPRNWLSWVNEPLTEAELAAVRECVSRGRPFGAERWQKSTARRLGLEASLRSRGRPRKK
jgi:putative transposase